MSFELFKLSRQQQISESAIKVEGIRFKYEESSQIQELIRYFKKEKGMDDQTIANVLTDNSLILEELSYKNDSPTNHEDLLDAGFVLGYLHAKHPGRIFGVVHDKIRYYFIGVETDIYTNIKIQLNKAQLK